MNDILKFLPEMKTGQDLIEELTVLPEYKECICYENQAVRLMSLSDLYKIYIPSAMTTEIYSKLYLGLLHSMQKKLTNTAIIQRNENYKATNQQWVEAGITGEFSSYPESDRSYPSSISNLSAKAKLDEKNNTLLNTILFNNQKVYNS